MLRIDTKSMHFAGSSMIDDVAVATFSASHNGGKDLYISISVADCALFAANQLMVEADMNDFHSEVLSTVLAATEAEAEEM
jgi:hypothetical protein